MRTIFIVEGKCSDRKGWRPVNLSGTKLRPWFSTFRQASRHLVAHASHFSGVDYTGWKFRISEYYGQSEPEAERALAGLARAGQEKDLGAEGKGLVTRVL